MITGLLHTFLKNKTLTFITVSLEILGKRKLYPCKFREIVLYSLEIPNPKIKTCYMEIQHNILLINPGNSTSISFDPWNFHMIFEYSWKFHALYLYIFVFSTFDCLFYSFLLTRDGF